MPADPVELRFPPRAEHLSLVRRAVATLVDGGPPITEARRDDIRLAVSEACANAVEATTRLGDFETEVQVRARLDGSDLVVEVLDHAGGFDPSALRPHPPVHTPERLDHERGLGIPLMRDLADDVAFVPTAQGTLVRLVWHLGRR